MRTRWLLLPMLPALFLIGCRTATPPAAIPDCLAPYSFTPEQNRFFDELQRRIVNYFWTEVYPETGIAIDHTENRTGKVAATGFELAAICIGVEHGWIPRADGYARARQILHAFWDDPADPADPFAEGRFGLYWHYLDGKTGRMLPLDCVAMCDSADFIAGAVVAGEYFKDTEVATLARRIYDNVQWDQFVSRNPDGSPGLLSFGWVPRGVSENYPDTDGLLGFNMVGFADNSLLIYALALGSDTHPIPPATWEQYVDSFGFDEYGGFACAMAGALFCRQVPAAFIPFSRLRDRKLDYFLDTVNAILADRAFNMQENGYPPELWGLTDCFGRDTYSHSAPPGSIMNDGTVGCTAFAGALPHVPAPAWNAMQYVLQRYSNRVWGRYGFTSSVNARNDFVSPLYVGIELGPLIMLIENARSGLIWDLFGRTTITSNFVRRARMSGVVDDFELPPEAPPYAVWTATGGAVAASDDRPQHGRRCLALQPSNDPTSKQEMRIDGVLTRNNLHQFHFNQYLSVWTRDFELGRCEMILDGRAVALKTIGSLTDGEWVDHFFAVPSAPSTAAICGLRLTGRVAGATPAIDNLSLEARAQLQTLPAVTDLRARPAKVPGAVAVEWTAPAAEEGRGAAAFRLRTAPADGRGPATETILAPNAPVGGTERHLLPAAGGQPAQFAVAAIDERGRRGPWSNTAETTPAAGTLDLLISDFAAGPGNALVNWNTNWTLRVADNGCGGRCLCINYKKASSWDYFFLKVDPQMVALHRYIEVDVRGRVRLLGKLWCRDGFEQDLDALDSTSDTVWTTLRFDTRKAPLIRPGRDEVRRFLLFVEPGRWGVEGSFCIDRPRYSN